MRACSILLLDLLRRQGALRMSARLHAALFIGGGSIGRGDELDQRLGGVRFLRPGRDAARERRELLDVGGQRADVVDAGEVRELAHLLEADLGLAAGDDAADEHARGRLLELWLDLVGDTQTLEQADHVDAARAGGITDRLRCQQRFLQRLGGADVRLRRAGFHAYPHAGFGQIDAAAGSDLAALDVLVDRGGGHDQEVIALACGQSLVGVERPREDSRDLVPGRLLELRHELAVCLLGGLGGQHLDLRRAGRGGEDEEACGAERCGRHRCSAHDRPPLIANAWPHSRILMPASLMTGPHLSISARRNVASSAGVEPTTTTPSCSSRSLVRGSVSAATISACIFRTTTGAVLAGANNAYQEETSKPGTPASAIGGRSGAAGVRLAVVTASPRSLPPRISGSTAPILLNITSTRPGSRSLRAGPAPR